MVSQHSSSNDSSSNSDQGESRPADEDKFRNIIFKLDTALKSVLTPEMISVATAELINSSQDEADEKIASAQKKLAIVMPELENYIQAGDRRVFVETLVKGKLSLFAEALVYLEGDDYIEIQALMDMNVQSLILWLCQAVVELARVREPELYGAKAAKFVAKLPSKNDRGFLPEE